MARTWPLLPGWVVSGILLVTSDRLWRGVTQPDLSGGSHESTPAWQLLAVIAISSALFLCARRIGPRLTSISNSSIHTSNLPAQGAAADFGTALVRVGSLAALYVVLFAMART